MKILLIADSGGTKTDWCYRDAHGRLMEFTGASYHPNQLNEQFILEQRQFWSTRKELLNEELHFFGAGCFREEKAARMHDALKAIGFSNISVRSDLEGAALATRGRSDGWVAILGTGSVLFEWRNQKVKSLLGGRGHLEGDEGSGFYFGKLVYQAWKEESLSYEQNALFEQNVDISALKRAIDEAAEKFEMASIAAKLSEHSLIFANYHRLNLKEFFDKYVHAQTIDTIHFVGSYATSQRILLEEISHEYTVKCSGFCDRPIHQIVEQIVAVNE